jgi:hypothetical protein
MKLRVKFIATLLSLATISFGQQHHYHYQRELKGVNDAWHKIILPDEVFGKVTQQLSDIRILGITASHDTLEAPYFIRFTAPKMASKPIDFKLLNSSHNDKGYYFTFEIPTIKPINALELDFEQQNFDWQTKLEGSRNQNEWFVLTDNYRILSIKNNLTDYRFTKLIFPTASYRYFRLQIKTSEKPELKLASLSQNEQVNGVFKNFTLQRFNIKENKATKETQISISLQQAVPICRLKIVSKDTFDYYRPIRISYLSDSIRTPKGWQYSYSTLASGILNSIETNEFNFSPTIAQHLEIYIQNNDNRPLHLSTTQVSGYVYELVARFTEKATYYLVYGNPDAELPNYDISRFSEKVPEPLEALALGDEKPTSNENLNATQPLFQNKLWLWVLMVLIIGVLGGFSINMIRKG